MRSVHVRDHAKQSDMSNEDEDLREEEERLRGELVMWCRAKLRQGYHFIPLQMAFHVMAHWMDEPEKYNLRIRSEDDED